MPGNPNPQSEVTEPSSGGLTRGVVVDWGTFFGQRDGMHRPEGPSLLVTYS